MCKNVCVCTWMLQKRYFDVQAPSKIEILLFHTISDVKKKKNPNNCLLICAVGMRTDMRRGPRRRCSFMQIDPRGLGET